MQNSWTERKDTGIEKEETVTIGFCHASRITLANQHILQFIFFLVHRGLKNGNTHKFH